MAKETEKTWSWVLTCEHASRRVPREYRALGLSRALLADHIGWDIGAREVQREMARELGAEAASSSVSRLLVDVNRRPDESSLIPEVSDGVVIPGNAAVSNAERARRIAAYHEPYHARIDRMVARAARRSPRRVRLLSIHSFTPVMSGVKRDFDIGVLFDAHVPLASALGEALVGVGFRVEYNEPYSGYEGLIYSAARHGRTHDVPYLELEINNLLLREARGVRRTAQRIVRALRAI